LNSFSLNNKLFTKVETGWINNDKGNLCIVYQIKENEYNARSFEDAFININRDFINKNKDSYKSLQNKDRFEDIGETAYTLANVCIKKKTHFALDILFHSNKDFSNWEIPAYINEGLLWLKQD